jgi:hypothetical protein
MTWRDDDNDILQGTVTLYLLRPRVHAVRAHGPKSTDEDDDDDEIKVEIVAAADD